MYCYVLISCFFPNLNSNIRYLGDTFIDKAFCHMIIEQEGLLLALCNETRMYYPIFDTIIGPSKVKIISILYSNY